MRCNLLYDWPQKLTFLRPKVNISQGFRTELFNQPGGDSVGLLRLSGKAAIAV